MQEQNTGGGSAAASPGTFTDESFFFNGGASNFFNGPGQSPLSQPWMFPQSTNPKTWYVSEHDLICN
jgi:hypothetical protein